MLLVLWKKWLNAPDNAARASIEETPEQWVENIQDGDSELRNQLIQKYHPYILKTTSRFFRRYIDPQRDDEFSVALSAFDEAISRYSPEGGRLFLGFAETVMRRRLIDYVRQEKKHAASVPYSAFDTESDDGAPMNRIEVTQALEVYNQELTADERRMEILSLTEELAVFGITFADLADHSPRHQDSRRTLLSMGKRLALNDKLFHTLRDKRQLPIKELCENETVSRKTIERHRKYLIAISLIVHGVYPYLQEYIGLDGLGKEESL
ncbi:RNA polymerase sigma factor SigI [Cohnella kolymensis]|uniref:RNA polymerase sigma factor SigI n=1 Tax=Cohnella kolymensis TaxID=1590652 RepID=A0ABR5A4L0_9BACL|nr:RNA polymerase sigma factor SigI [Cohnella kolymensis]KIL35930.1 RNA polymerase sigma factor SigI [Cohnella kolymensis]